MDYYVSSSGNDENPGTAELPLKTIRRLADLMHSGDTGYLNGIFHEQLKLGGINGIPGGKHALAQTTIKSWGTRPIIIGDTEPCLQAGDPDTRYVTVIGIDLKPGRQSVGCLFDMPHTSGYFTLDDTHVVPDDLCLNNIVVRGGGPLYFTGLKAINAELDNVLVIGSETHPSLGVEIDRSEITGSRLGSNFAVRQTSEFSTAGTHKILRTVCSNAAEGNIDLSDRSSALVEFCRLSNGGTRNIRTGMGKAVIRYNLMDNDYHGENILISSDTTTDAYSNILRNAGYGVRFTRDLNIEVNGTGKTHITHNTIVYQTVGGIHIDDQTIDDMFADQKGVLKTRYVILEDLNTEDGDGVVDDVFGEEQYIDLRSLFIENNLFALTGNREYIRMDGIQPVSLFVGVDGNRYFGSTRFDAWGGLNYAEWRDLGRDAQSGDGIDPGFSDALNENFTVSHIAYRFSGVTPSSTEEIRSIAIPFEQMQTVLHDKTPGAFAFSSNLEVQTPLIGAESGSDVLAAEGQDSLVVVP